MTDEEGGYELPALFVGRFQPFHKGHLFMIKRILEDFDRLIIGIGSAQYSNTVRNPFSSEERLVMISKALENEGVDSCDIVLIDDTNDHSIWVESVESVVPGFGVVFSNDPLTVSLFREKNHEVREPPLHKREEYSGTEIRERIGTGKDWEELVPEVVAEYILEIDGVKRIAEIFASKGSQGQQDQEDNQ